MTNLVKDQYETYPYPARTPKDEIKRLVTGSPSHLSEIRHWLFEGKIPQHRPFRILVAGGGTGDGLTMIAQQADNAGLDTEIIYMDLSEASRKTAEARIALRGLSHKVQFVTGSLLKASDYGPFDYIDCCGVLHHLPTPQEGFQALAHALAPQGGMGIMVYGQYGRVGVYETQAALRLLRRESDDPQRQVSLARRYLSVVPPTNRLRRNSLVQDHKTGGDAGIYDLLLHSTDRAYTISQLEAEIVQAGLQTVTYIDPVRYDPDTYIQEQDLRNRAADLTLAERAALAEAIAGNMPLHIAYLTAANRQHTPTAHITDTSIPVFRDEKTQAEFQTMPRGATSLPVTVDGLSLHIPLPLDAKPILDNIDGRRSISELREKHPNPHFDKSFQQLFKALNGVSRLFLYHP